MLLVPEIVEMKQAKHVKMIGNRFIYTHWNNINKSNKNCENAVKSDLNETINERLANIM